MTKVVYETLKTSELVRLSYQYLWDGNTLPTGRGPAHGFMCSAIHTASFMPYYRKNGAMVVPLAGKAYHKAAQYIRERVGSSFRAHLQAKGVPIHAEAMNCEWIQLRRREFLCNMISYFEALGD